MKGKALKYIILLATISIASVFLVQFAFLRSSYRISEKQFRESTNVALKEVAWQVMLATGTTAHFDSITPVEQISRNTFLVNTGVAMDKELLKGHLIEQLKKHDIFYEFEFAIYNASAEQMDDGLLIKKNGKETASCYTFPVNEKYRNYFGVHFPKQSTYLNSSLSIWYFMTALLIVILFFFGYTLSVIIRQRQLSEVQKNFINNLTHELKTPISSIALSARVLNDRSIIDSPDRLFQYARIIQDQNSRLSKNVEKVLNLASLEKSKIRLKQEPVQLNQFIEETIKLFKQTTSGQKATIKIDYGNMQPTIDADKFHLSNLMNNILENAVKYCEQEPRIQIKLSKHRHKLLLQFADNGIGISKEHKKKIFKKFYRVPTGNVHNVKGFGLGLDYVHKIVKAHNWKINVHDNSNGGSIFTLTIAKYHER